MACRLALLAVVALCGTGACADGGARTVTTVSTYLDGRQEQRTYALACTGNVATLTIRAEEVGKGVKTFDVIPSFATAPALIIVGFMMLSSAADIDWSDASEAVPAFLAIAVMPFSYSISDGIMAGVIAYTLINLLAGKTRKIHWIMYVLTVLFVAKYALM